MRTQEQHESRRQRSGSLVVSIPWSRISQQTVKSNVQGLKTTPSQVLTPNQRSEPVDLVGAPVFDFEAYTETILGKMRQVMNAHEVGRITMGKMQKARKSRHAIINCRHTHRPHYSKGLCKSCYNLKKYYVYKRPRRF